jgi:hypothetical protein
MPEYARQRDDSFGSPGARGRLTRHLDSHRNSNALHTTGRLRRPTAKRRSNRNLLESAGPGGVNRQVEFRRGRGLLRDQLLRTLLSEGRVIGAPR